MPVTIECSPVKPERFDFDRAKTTTSPAELFVTSASRTAEKLARDYDMKTPTSKARAPPPSAYTERCLRVQMNDPPPGDFVSDERIVKCTNGLVHTLVKAYNEHHHLVLRPDDVWHAILAQFSLYVQANSEKLRETFVAHEGKKQLTIMSGGTIESADFGDMAQRMGDLLEQNVKDPSLRSWILPDFSTSTENDTTIASVMMMATLQKYFDFKFSLLCGIPSVTLLGTVDDWNSLRTRIDKLDNFGEECTQWAAMLRPVCDSFVTSFDVHQLEATKDFWSRVCHYEGGGSGPTYLCGWSTVFTIFSKEGKWQGTKWSPPRFGVNPESETTYGTWPLVDSDDVAPACAEVPVLVDDNGTEHKTVMLSGLPGTRVSTNEKGEAVLAPAAGWAMFDVGDS